MPSAGIVLQGAGGVLVAKPGRVVLSLASQKIIRLCGGAAHLSRPQRSRSGSGLRRAMSAPVGGSESMRRLTVLRIGPTPSSSRKVLQATRYVRATYI